MSNRLCNYCEFTKFKEKHPKSKIVYKTIKTGKLKGWKQVYINGKPIEWYMMSIGKDCDC